MDSSDFPISKSPRKEIQGPRPTPLKIRKDSYKIRKPPIAPPPQQQQQQSSQQHVHQHQYQQHHPQQYQSQPRPPVIIYTVSPKVIHTNPNDFMTLVQRLTGSSSSSTTSSNSCATSKSKSYDPFNNDHGAISPAARYASIEKTKLSSPEKNKQQEGYHNISGNLVEGMEMDHNIGRSSNLFPGILSPGPTSLPAISPNFFTLPTTTSDPNNFFHDLSPVLHGNRNFIEGSFMPSPSSSSFLNSPHLNSSPTPSIDLFNNFNFFDY